MTAMYPQTASYDGPYLEVVAFENQPGLIERIIGEKR
jgi:hypothetical protein